MATHDYVIDNASGAGVRSDINNALQAIVSNNSSSTEPSPTFAYMNWQDTGNNLLKQRNSSNNAWITLRNADGSFPNISIADGTQSAPSFTFADDSNLGFYRVGADHIAITCGDSTKFEVNTSVTKSNQQLSVNNDVFITGSSPRLTFDETGDSNVSKSFIFIQDEGRLDMRHGETGNGNYAFSVTPGSKTTNATDYNFDFKKSSVTISRGLTVDGTGTASASQASIHLKSTNAGRTTFDPDEAGIKITAKNMNTTNKYTPSISFGSTDDDFTTENPKYGAAIIAEAAQTFSGDDKGGMNLTFWTSPVDPGTGQGLVQRMTVKSNGNVGVATTSLATNAELTVEVERSDANKGHALLGIRQVGSYSAGSIVPTGFIRLAEGNTQDQNIFVGTDNKLRITGDASNIGGTGGSVVGDQTSDIRLKTLLDTPVPGLSKIKELNPIRFTYNNASGERLGFSAQDVQAILPESVYDTNDPIPGEADDAPTILAMRYTEMIPVLVNAVKELSTQVEALTARVAALEA